MSASHLLDANALISLVIAEHEHHGRVTAWVTEVDKVALCPITEGAMVRYLIRVGETTATASQLLKTLRESPRVDFWPDSISYTEAALEHVTGHRQVTDAYLASLAASNQARLATLDVALAAELSATVDLIP
ncbi:MAG: PIN domain-containing protein [Actinomycetota bacterium]|nr:PIN domain-containing protein [Actinomycetota bacterium]